MPRQINSLERFVALRAALEKERATLEHRLREIDAALGKAAGPAPTMSMRPAPAKRPGRPTVQNKLSIREAIGKVTAHKSLSIREIVDAVQRIGYRFQSSNPVNSVGAYLYGPEGKKHFKRADGKFAAK